MTKKGVSVIVPAKNEGEGLGEILRSLKPFSDDIIVVDGHSQDNTREISKKYKARYFLDHKLGRGDAVKIGIKNAKHNIIVLFDADGSHNEKDIPKLIEPLKKNKADIVICSRRTGGSFDMKMNLDGLLRSAGSDLMVMLINYKFKTALTDALYSFRALNAKKIKRLKLRSNNFSIEQEMIVSCLKKGYRIVEIPSREKARAWGKPKLRTLTGIKLLIDLIGQLYFFSY